MKNKTNLPGFTAGVVFSTVSNTFMLPDNSSVQGATNRKSNIIPSIQWGRRPWLTAPRGILVNPTGDPCPDHSTCCCADLGGFSCVGNPGRGACTDTNYPWPVETL